MSHVAYARGPKKWFLVIFVVFLIAVFAMPVSTSFLGDDPNPPRGRLDGEEVSLPELQTTRRCLGFLAALYSDARHIYYALALAAISEQEREYAVWNHYFLADRARRLGLTPGREEIDEYLRGTVWEDLLRPAYNASRAGEAVSTSLPEDAPYDEAAALRLVHNRWRLQWNDFHRVLGEVLAVNRYTALLRPPPLSPAEVARIYGARRAELDADFLFVPLEAHLDAAVQDLTVQRLLAGARRKVMAQTELWPLAPSDDLSAQADPWFKSLGEETEYYDLDRELIGSISGWAANTGAKDYEPFREPKKYHVSLFWYPQERAEARAREEAQSSAFYDEVLKYHREHPEVFAADVAEAGEGTAPPPAGGEAAAGAAAPAEEARTSLPRHVYREIERLLRARKTRQYGAAKAQELADAYLDPNNGLAALRKVEWEREIGLLAHQLSELAARKSFVENHVEGAITGGASRRADSLFGVWEVQRTKLETLVRDLHAEWAGTPEDRRAAFWTDQNGERARHLRTTAAAARAALFRAFDQKADQLQRQWDGFESARKNAEAQLERLRERGGAQFEALDAADQNQRARHEFTVQQQRRLIEQARALHETFARVRTGLVADWDAWDALLAAPAPDLAALHTRECAALVERVNRRLGTDELLADWRRAGQTVADVLKEIEDERTRVDERRQRLVKDQREQFPGGGSDRLNLERYPHEDTARRVGVEWLPLPGPRTLDALRAGETPADGRAIPALRGAREYRAGVPGADATAAARALEPVLDDANLEHRLSPVLEVPGRGFAVVLLHARIAREDHTLATRATEAVQTQAREKQALDATVAAARELRAAVALALAEAATPDARRAAVARVVAAHNAARPETHRVRRWSFDRLVEGAAPLEAEWAAGGAGLAQRLRELGAAGQTTALVRATKKEAAIDLDRGVAFAVLIARHEPDPARMRYADFSQVRETLMGDYLTRERQRRLDFFRLADEYRDFALYSDTPGR